MSACILLHRPETKTLDGGSGLDSPGSSADNFEVQGLEVGLCVCVCTSVCLSLSVCLSVCLCVCVYVSACVCVRWVGSACDGTEPDLRL